MTSSSSPDPARDGPRLVGVGVGPGDPSLLTLQALEALRGADRVVAPATAPDAQGRAESVVRRALPDLHLERVVFAMATEGSPGGAEARETSHRDAAAALLPWLDAGETVAFVTLGDPNLYSTFPSLAQAVLAVRPEVAVSTVPGICAFQVLAAASGTVLLDGTESMALVTALDGDEDFARAVTDPTRAVVVYKGGRHLPAMIETLQRSGRLEGAVLGELLGLAGERVTRLDALVQSGARIEPASYLATVIVPPAGRETRP